MINFYNQYVTCSNTATLADVAGEAVGRDEVGAHCHLIPSPGPSVPTDHMDHVKKVAGIESVGFGGDYDGVTG